MARLDREHSHVMSEVGESVKARRKALGMSQDDLANEAGVNRDTLGAIENGQGYRASSLTKIEQALERIEHEVGMDAPPAGGKPNDSGLIEFDISGDFGVHLVVRGPVADADALQRQVIGIIREIRQGNTETSSEPPVGN